MKLLVRNLVAYADSLRSPFVSKTHSCHAPGNFSQAAHYHIPTSCSARANAFTTIVVSPTIARTRDPRESPSSSAVLQPAKRTLPLNGQRHRSAEPVVVGKRRPLRLEAKRRLNPFLATALLQLPDFPKLRHCSVEAAVSAATTDQPFPRLHTRRKQATLRDRLTRPP